jgi:hypothetical protein
MHPLPSLDSTFCPEFGYFPVDLLAGERKPAEANTAASALPFVEVLVPSTCL